MILKEYKVGEPLAENEYLLKLRQDEDYHPESRAWSLSKYKTGFLIKLTKKGEIPVKFYDWGGRSYGESGRNLPIYVFEEVPMSGWAILKWRFGQSQNWATMKHPEGFTVEIYLNNLLEIIKNHSVNEGFIVGKFKWEDNKLTPK